MCELLHTLKASFLECGEHAVGTECRFSAGGDGGRKSPEQFACVPRTTCALVKEFQPETVYYAGRTLRESSDRLHRNVVTLRLSTLPASSFEKSLVRLSQLQCFDALAHPSSTSKAPRT